MSAAVDVPPLPQVRSRAGQNCLQPSVGDGLVGLALLVLPLVALLAYWGAAERSRLVLIAGAGVYAWTSIIAIRGFLSDSSPWRITAPYLPLRAHIAALVFGFSQAWAGLFAGMPDSQMTKELISKRVSEFSSETASAIASASSAGESAPGESAMPVATGWEDFLITDRQAPVGMVFLIIAAAALAWLTYTYIVARRAQLVAYPAAGPLDIPKPPVGGDPLAPNASARVDREVT